MSGEGAVLTLVAEPSRRETLRFLGYPDGTPRTPGVAARLDALWESSLALVEARGAWRIVDAYAARAIGMPEAGDRAGLAVCTIGPALETEASRHAAAGRVMEALLLEAIGSAAAEAAADALNQVLCHAALGLGLRAAPRVSPGYGAWATSAQRDLLRLLPVDRLGVTLTDGAMMVPRKSVSFAVALVPPSALERDAGSPCRHCGLERCRHRIAGDAGRVEDCG